MHARLLGGGGGRLRVRLGVGGHEAPAAEGGGGEDEALHGRLLGPQDTVHLWREGGKAFSCGKAKNCVLVREPSKVCVCLNLQMGVCAFYSENKISAIEGEIRHKIRQRQLAAK